jgi:hypothetical protein
VDRLGAPAVFVRLDERGGRNDPAPWAFHTAYGPSPLPSSMRDDGSGKDVVDLVALRAALDGETGEISDTGGTLDLTPGDAKVKVEGPNAAGPDEETDPVFTRGDKAVSDSEPTVSKPAPIPVPPARGAASVLLVKKSGLLPGPAIHVGRTENNDIVLPEMSVSKLHAKVYVESNGKVTVQDVGSSNGTRVNDTPLEEDDKRAVITGDIVVFGDVRCLFLDADSFAANLERFMD